MSSMGYNRYPDTTCILNTVHQSTLTYIFHKYMRHIYTKTLKVMQSLEGCNFENAF